MSETVELDRASDPKAVRGYALFDWGKSAFETSVTVAILPAWFAYLFLKANGLTTTIGSIEMTGDAIWSFSVTAAALLVAIVSPSLGVIADRRRIKMWWLKNLTYLGAGATFMLALAPMFVNSEWIWLMVFFVLANIGLNGAGVFYNALLPHMGTDDEMDRISNLAFAYGYLGGGLLLVVHLAMVMALEGDWIIPFCMASSGIWWYCFALFTFKWVPEPPMEKEMEALGFGDSARLAFREIKKTLGEVDKFRTLFIYMLAYFFFIDGINTVTALGGVFGTVVLGITPIDLMVTILAIQFVAAPSAVAFTRLARRVGTKPALSISLVGWVLLCFGALAFAPLQLDSHDDYQIQYDWDEASMAYNVQVHTDTPQIAQKLDYEANEFDEQGWASSWAHVLPLEEDDRSNTLKWLIYERDSDGVSTDERHTKLLIGIDNEEIRSLVESLSDSRFSASVSGGPLDTTSEVGIDHPTNLGDGMLDAIPENAREYVWEPLGISVGIQFLILGCAMGTLLGGSQGLARSLFGQMVPETRSDDFFGFFGFCGKVTALIGPLLYGFMTVAFDSRVGILAVSMLILTGALMMRLVDVEKGREDARNEDIRNRA